MASRSRSVARCTECGHQQPRWVGRCPGCEAWGTMVEAVAARGPGPASTGRPAAQPIGDISLLEASRIVTGLAEFDRVLGGGVVAGAVALLGGEPGVGKSTLLLQAAHAIASAGHTVLYLSGEESTLQLRLRAERLGALAPCLLVAAETELPAVASLVESHRPAVVVIDSVQTLTDPGLSSAPGSVVQVREGAATLTRLAKRTATAALLVGHVTKDGRLAGPRAVEHLVDVVLNFEGEAHHALRLLRATKNRFGAVGEIGCFEMAGDGLRAVPDPSRLFTTDHDPDASGVAVTVTVEGPRPLAVEVQALVAPTHLAAPRRQASGLDASRLPLLVAVLERRAALRLAKQDLFASAVGGVRLHEPAADLAICLAIASTRLNRPVPRALVAIGEVGLAGELRSVPQMERRLAEAARLGYTTGVVPATYRGHHHGLRLRPARQLHAALDTALAPARGSAVADLASSGTTDRPAVDRRPRVRSPHDGVRYSHS